tara:strand:- start:201 stop:332 length:132 start_codon:yes stop_codon:yes gene_type:complete
MLDATNASVELLAKEVIGSAPIRTNALDAMSNDELDAVDAISC